MYAKERAKCSFAYRGARKTALRASRDSKGAQLLGARLCLQSLMRYTVQAGDRAKAVCRRYGQRWFAWSRQIKPVLGSIGFICH